MNIIMPNRKLRNKTGICFWGLILLCIVSCNRTYPISENVLLWNTGNLHQKLIIYNDGGRAWKRTSGFVIIPSDTQSIKNIYSGIDEYVDYFSNNKEWLLAKTIAIADSCMEERYWIIHFSNNGKMYQNEVADSTIGPFTKAEFNIVSAQKQIDQSLLTDFLSQK